MPLGQLPQTTGTINVDWRKLGRGGPTLHRAVRDAFREAIHDWHTQREAFNAALKLVRRHARGASDEEARRLVAQMLSEEPQRERGPAPERVG